MHMTTIKDRILGAILGLACGDALGVTNEFLQYDEIFRKHGIIEEITGGGVFEFDKGECSDDTDMMLCVAKGILKNPENPVFEVGQNFIKWYKTNPKDVGATCRSVIHGVLKYKNDFFTESLTYHNMTGKSAGNGSLMRCLPIGLFYKDCEEMRKRSAVISKMTHWDEEATRACMFYNSLVQEFLSLTTRSKSDILEMYLVDFPEYKGVQNLRMEDVMNPSAYVVDTLKSVLWCFMWSNDYESCVKLAVNLGGDTDTVGAIAGGLAGVYYGVKNIPERWLKEIKLRDELTEIANEIYQARKIHIPSKCTEADLSVING